MRNSGWWYKQQAATQINKPISSNELEIQVVGVTFGNRQQIISTLKVGDQVRLRRDPENSFDQNAIHVERTDGASIGFVGKELAKQLAPIFDRHSRCLDASISVLVGGQLSGSARGVRIKFILPEQLQRSALPSADEIEGL